MLFTVVLRPPSYKPQKNVIRIASQKLNLKLSEYHIAKMNADTTLNILATIRILMLKASPILPKMIAPSISPDPSPIIDSKAYQSFLLDFQSASIVSSINVTNTPVYIAKLKADCIIRGISIIIRLDESSFNVYLIPSEILGGLSCAFCNIQS